MSFSATPLGQGRRYDHSDFLRKNHSNNSANSHHPSAPKIITSPPRSPEKLKDTSVNIAAAFTQAVLTQASISEMNQNPANSSWASTSNRAAQQLPRSTSVEYEQQAATANRRLNAPPSRSRFGGPNSSGSSRSIASAKPVNGVVPDSEGEEADESTQSATVVPQRGVSPLNVLQDVASDVGRRFAYFVRQRSHEPEADRSGSTANDSYDYANEEQQFQAQMQAQQPRAVPAGKSSKPIHKRTQISADNKAYKPTASDMEESDEEFSEKRRKRKKKKGITEGRVTTLPRMEYGSTRRRRARTGAAANGDAQDDSDSDDSNELQDDASQGNSRSSLQPSSRRAPNTSLDDAEQGLPGIQEEDENTDDLPLSDTQTSPDLLSPPPLAQRHRSATPQPQPQRPSRRFSPGAFVGNLIHYTVSMITLLCFLIGQFVGFITRTLFVTPLSWLSSPSYSNPTAALLRYMVLGLALGSVWYALSSPALLRYVPHFGRSRPSKFVSPNVAPADLAELSARLQVLESAVTLISNGNEQLTGDVAARTAAHEMLQAELRKVYGDLGKVKSEVTSYTSQHGSLVGKLGGINKKVEELHGKSTALDAQLDSLNGKIGGLERQGIRFGEYGTKLSNLERQLKGLGESGAASGRGGGDDEVSARLRELADGVEDVRAQVKALKEGRGTDEDHARYRALEDRIGSVEGSVREALEVGKQQQQQSGAKPWWTKISGTSGRPLTLKTTDGQDVSDLLASIVHEQIVGQYGRDLLGKPDYALHSAGGRVIPSLTSATVEVHPTSMLKSVIGYVLGSGRAVGLPPVTALHHELRNGRCWPFPGTHGQLGIVLAAPVFIDEVVVEHIPSDVAYDARSAPKEMEVWGLVEGADNLQRLQEWKDARAAAGAEEEAYPETLPYNVPYTRIARFSYDIHASNAVQTFAVDPEIAGLGIDFGVVVFMVRSNWGRDEYTCLYRVRVHGQPLIQ